MTIKHDPPAEGNPSAAVRPPEASPMPSAASTSDASKTAEPPRALDLVALQQRRGLCEYFEHLEALSLPELYAFGFDMGEDDPAQSLGLFLTDELVTIRAAVQAEDPLSETILDRALFRAGNIARVAAELHRRQRSALLDALGQEGRPR